MGSDLGDGSLGQMMLPGPPSSDKDQRPGQGRRAPPFSDPGIERPSLPISGRGGPLPPLHPPPSPPSELWRNPDLLCTAAKGGGGPFAVDSEGWKAKLARGALLARGQAGRESCGWGEGGPPVWVWNEPCILGMEAWIQNPGLPAWARK